MKATGGCLCGAVRFTADIGDDVHACHCNMCRAWGGGPAIVAIAASMELEGDVARYDSSSWAERGFCARCGSSLFYRLKETDGYYVAMGAFDDQSRFALVDEIYIDEKPTAYDFAGDRPRLTREQFLASLRQGAT
jgi:hypothetical protein